LFCSASQAVLIYGDYQFNAVQVERLQQTSARKFTMNTYFIAPLAFLASLLVLTVPVAALLAS